MMRPEPELVRLAPRAGARPSSAPPVRIFLGSEDAQYRAERVFFYSIERARDPGRTYEIFLMKNLAGFSSSNWRTNFTNYRFAIPDFAGRGGRAIYNDVDQIYLADPAELFDRDMGTHGYLAVSRLDTSVMLLDCERMGSWWNRERASALDKAELLAGPAAQAGLWGAIEGEWNARDLEYVEGRSKCVHFTALHTQPWQPTPEQYSYHPHPLAEVWERLERDADAEAYEVFGPGRPSFAFQAAARSDDAPDARGIESAERWIRRTHPRSVMRCSLGDTRLPTLNGSEATDFDFASGSAPPAQSVDAVVAAGVLERAPLDDVPWLLDGIFRAARSEVYVAITCPSQAQSSGERLRSPEWWREQLASAARRSAGHAGWRLDLFTGARNGRPIAYAAPGAGVQSAGRVWVLCGNKAGDNRQLLTLATALGWPYDVKQLAFNALHHVPPLFLDESTQSLDRNASDPLEPPWPDIVISAGKRSVPVARWIRAQSGGRTRMVHVGRPWAPLDWFDLIITTPQYALPARPNVLHNTMPLNRADPARLARALDDGRWQAAVAPLPKPHIAVLVGGSSSSHVLSEECARELGEAASNAARAAAGSLLVTTSPRTPAVAVEALRTAITVPASFHVFGHAENPYDAFLALADSFIVTGDSASMLAEACSTGKPVRIFSLPRRHEQVWGVNVLVELAQSLRGGRVTYRGTPKQQDALDRLFDRIVEQGLITPPRNLDAYYEALEARGLASRINGAHPAVCPKGPDDLERAVTRVREMLRAERRVVEETQGGR